MGLSSFTVPTPPTSLRRSSYAKARAAAKAGSPATNDGAASAQNHRPRLIPLTRGRFAIVDAEDYPRLSRFIWFAEGTPKNYYAVRKENGKSIKMHRQITSAPDHLVEKVLATEFAENAENIIYIFPL